MTKNNSQPPAIVIGLDDGTTGIQTARILAARGVPVIALAKNPKHYCCRTNVCERIEIVEWDTAALIPHLQQLGRSLGQKGVLFPCQDNNVRLVSRHREALEAWFHIALPPPEIVEMMLDKAQFYQFAAERGLPIPQSFNLTTRDEAVEAAARLSYPAIVKPESRSKVWLANTNEKALRVDSAESLLRIYDQYHAWTDQLIAQTYIEGSDRDHYAFNGYFDRNQQPVVSVTTRKIRQWPPRTGQGCSGEVVQDEAVCRVAMQLFCSVPFYGLGYVELKRDSRTGEYLIIEPNIGRPTGRSASAEAADQPLLWAQYCEAVGRPFPTPPPIPATPIKWFHWRRDMQASFYYWRRGELTVRQWIDSLRGKRWFAIWSWRDPVPFFADWWRVAQLALSAEERKKRNY